MIREIIAVACGGALGAVLRFTISYSAVYLLGKSYPFGTLVVNVLGSLLMGMLAIEVLDRMTAYSSVVAAFLLVGFLGGFTTFSSFSIETFRLFYDGNYTLGIINIIANVGLCIAATALGFHFMIGAGIVK